MRFHEHLDRLALVHHAVSLVDLVEADRLSEDRRGIEGALQHIGQQLFGVRADESDAAREGARVSGGGHRRRGYLYACIIHRDRYSPSPEWSRMGGFNREPPPTRSTGTVGRRGNAEVRRS